ncbi:MAG: hypothetical protein ACOC46_04340 [Pirellulales bacterium]
MFGAPMLSLRARNRFFGTRGPSSRAAARALNRKLAVLSRVVVHPTYRGAGLAAAFVRHSCRTCPWPWIETLSEMGHLNPFFEHAGFRRLGLASARRDSRQKYSALWGGRAGRKQPGRGGAVGKAPRRRLVTPETYRKSRFAQPVYYLFDNRPNVPPVRPAAAAPSAQS